MDEDCACIYETKPVVRLNRQPALGYSAAFEVSDAKGILNV
jgi:hypothetical protein